jgi:glycosyltransferase involved in cell wall biosynthesis
MLLISVIIPAYNAEKTIQETMESVLNQTFTDFDLIIINDGSTDATLEIINSISDTRIKVFSYVNQGIAINRNRGLTYVKGKYISFLDQNNI